MPNQLSSRRALLLEDRMAHPIPRPLPVPVARLDLLLPRQEPNHVVERAASSSSTNPLNSAHSCGPHDNSGACEKPTDSGSGITLPVVLGSVIPLTFAIIVLLFLHRRHLKKLRLEDKNDKHKSLDFGMDEVNPSGGKKNRNTRPGMPEMSISDAEKTLRHGRGMSLDMENPYLLPPGLQNSRESLHSMSRTIPGDDRFRPATNYIPNDETRSYSPSMRRALDDSSSHTGSSRHRMQQDDMSKNLLKNAQRMSRTVPPTLEVSSPSGQNINLDESNHPYILDRKDLPRRPDRSLSPSPAQSQRSSVNKDTGLRNSNMYLSKFIHSRDPSADLLSQSTDQPKHEAPISEPKKPLPAITRDQSPAVSSRNQSPLASTRNASPPAPSALPSNPRPPRKQSMEAPMLPPLHDIYSSEKSEFTIHENEFSTSPDEYAKKEQEFGNVHQNNLHPVSNSRDVDAGRPRSGRFSLDAQEQQYDDADYGYDEQDFQGNTNRRTMGVVPLPPEDPNDTPEERATRIKSFYKEYFDSSKPGQPAQPAQHGPYGQHGRQGQYPDQGYNGYYEDYSNYNQEYQNGGPGYDEVNGQFVTGQNHFYEEPITRRAMTPPPRGPPRFRGPQGHMSSGSGGYKPGPRAYSSASYGQGPQGPPKKQLPPPGPLRTLPTPHLLKDDTFIPIEFAPPTSMRDRVAGRPESPLGIPKPYSPSLPSFNPMASSFEDLPMMPSPHALRKSSTFTALDFAPPPRFKNSDSGSDAGSVRSGRSGMSNNQLHAIRAGAYRLSRVPKEASGTRNELAESLKPKWDMSR